MYDLRTLRQTKLDARGEHYYADETKEGILPWREWIRRNLPQGPEGFSFEDIDGVVFLHGVLSPVVPKFMLLEFKLLGTKLDKSQFLGFQQIDRLLRRADPRGREYFGFYIVEWPRDFPAPYARINYRHLLNAGDLREFFLFNSDVKSYFEEAR